MHVIATAGHVDHGKSTLVRALTGIEPDRWAEEHRRGLTIDLGYAWTTLPSGEEVAFVDVPGHERFIGNMLAGLGPVPAVMFVVAADEGWRAQSAEHLAAVDALGIRRGLLVVTRNDLADPAPVLADASQRLARTSLGRCTAVAVSGRTGAGLPELREALDRLVRRIPAPDTDGRARLWLDRAFTIRGSGTVVTGTLGQGSVCVGDELEVAGHPDVAGRRVRVRAVQSLERPREAVPAVARVALNLRGVAPDEVPRGRALVTPGAWWHTSVVDVRLDAEREELPEVAMLHVGTASMPARIRPLSGHVARLTLPMQLPLAAGDRAILRDPGAHRILSGALVLDADPPALRHRGDGRRRGEALARAGATPDVVSEVERRGAMRRAHASALGIDVDAAFARQDANGVVAEGEWLVARSAVQRWGATLAEALRRQTATQPLDPSLPLEAARQAARIPDAALVRVVAAKAGLEIHDGRVWQAGVRPSLGSAEAGLAAVEARLAAQPFAAPERPELEAAGLGPRELAAAERLGRIVRLPDDVVLLPTAIEQARVRLARLPQPFATSQARQVLGTTRRIVIPLLEHLDRLGVTRRLDSSHREVVR